MEISTSMPSIITVKGLTVQHLIVSATLPHSLAIKAHLQQGQSLLLSSIREVEQSCTARWEAISLPWHISISGVQHLEAASDTADHMWGMC